MTQAQLCIICSLDKAALHKMLLGSSFNEAMQLRREMQQALTKYSRGKSKWDVIQVGAMYVLHQVERWCRDSFFRHRLPQLLRQETSLLTASKKTAKWHVKKEWEALCARAMY